MSRKARERTRQRRHVKILSLRKKGLSYRQIASEVGVSWQAIQYHISPFIKVKRKLIASHLRRKTCFLCQSALPSASKFCESCVKTHKLGVGGKELTRGMVRARDANTCQVCGYVWKRTQKKRLDVHHMEGLCGTLTKSYDRPEMMHKLITVCHKCHYNLNDHREYGLKVRSVKVV